MPKPFAIVGELISFKALERAPVNEHGVVFLFGIIAELFHFQIEAIRKDFPDCIARRKVGKDKWELLRIEFEFESKNFETHKHDASQVDMIVCWNHTWSECPEHIEVMELSKLVRDWRAFEKKPARQLTDFQKFMQKNRLAGLSMAEAGKLWSEQTGVKKKPPQEPASGSAETPLAYRGFVKQQRLAGKTMAEAAALWKTCKEGKA
jgi:hypothetical protein